MRCVLQTEGAAEQTQQWQLLSAVKPLRWEEAPGERHVINEQWCRTSTSVHPRAWNTFTLSSNCISFLKHTPYISDALWVEDRALCTVICSVMCTMAVWFTCCYLLSVTMCKIFWNEWTFHLLSCKLEFVLAHTIHILMYNIYFYIFCNINFYVGWNFLLKWFWHVKTTAY